MNRLRQIVLLAVLLIVSFVLASRVFGESPDSPAEPARVTDAPAQPTVTDAVTPGFEPAVIANEN